MKGIIFNLLEEVVVQRHGADSWDDLLDAAGVDGAFTSLGNYPDEVMGALVAAAARRFGSSPAEITRWFGREALPALAVRYPGFFQNHTSVRTFLPSLNSIIHPEVRKVYPGADAPDFDFTGSTRDTLIMRYRSRRRLCALAWGLIEGSAARFGERVTVEHRTCMLSGAESCVFEIELGPAAAAAKSAAPTRTA